MAYDELHKVVELDQRGMDAVVIKAGDEGLGTRYRATLRDSAGIGIGKAPSDAMEALAKSLEDLVRRIRDRKINV